MDPYSRLLLRASGRRHNGSRERADAIQQASVRGASHEVLAAETGLSYSRVSQIIRGIAPPRPCGCAGPLHDCEAFPVPEWARRYLDRFDPRAT